MVYAVCHSPQQSDKGLHCLPFSTVWSGSTLFTILSRLIKVKVYTVILRNILIRFYTICHSQQSDHGLHYLPFSAVCSRSRSTLSFSGSVRSGSTLFTILSSLIKVYTVCHSQESDQGLHCLPFSAVSSRSTMFPILSSLFRVTLFPIISSLIRIYTVCHSQQSDQGLHYLPFSVWSGSTPLAIISSLTSGYIICHQSDQGLHCLPFSAVWSGSTLFAIFSLMKVFTISHSQQSDLGLQYLPFSAVWSGSTLFAILSSLIKVYTICNSF